MKQQKRNTLCETDFVKRYMARLEQVGLSFDTQADAALSVKAVFDVIQDALSDGRAVNRQGFGKFEIRHRRARNGHNPQTNEKIELPKITTVGFRPGRQLRRKVAHLD